MKFLIHQPAKSAMQSGKENSKKWLMEPIEEINIRSQNNVMGWVSASNTSSQLSWAFATKEEAQNFAKAQNFSYEISEPKNSSVKKKSYAANFTG